MGFLITYFLIPLDHGSAVASAPKPRLANSDSFSYSGAPDADTDEGKAWEENASYCGTGPSSSSIDSTVAGPTRVFASHRERSGIPAEISRHDPGVSQCLVDLEW